MQLVFEFNLSSVIKLIVTYFISLFINRLILVLATNDIII